MASIKQKIKILRLEYGMKIKDIAPQIGVCKSAAYKYSSGERLKPSQDVEDRADALIEKKRKEAQDSK